MLIYQHAHSLSGAWGKYVSGKNTEPVRVLWSGSAGDCHVGRMNQRREVMEAGSSSGLIMSTTQMNIGEI